MPVLAQTAYNSVAKYSSRKVKSTFTSASKPGSLVVAILAMAGGLGATVSIDQSGWTRVQDYAVRDLQLTLWYKENAPAVTSVTASVDANRSMQLRLLEYTGVAQSASLDKFGLRTSGWSEDDDPFTAPTGTLAQNDELVLAVVTNQYTASQIGFTGGFTKMFDNTSPKSDLEEWERGRVTVHQLTPGNTNSQQLKCDLSTDRRWITFILAFKGNISGPCKLASTVNTGIGDVFCKGLLSAFGPLRSTASNDCGRVNTSVARIGPYNYQYRLGGWTGLLIGSDTNFPLESVEGLEGWNMRTSDDDLPRDDGSLRGTDLQSARQIVFKVNWDGNFPGDFTTIEQAADQLFRTLIPQRDDDWELIYRHPGRPLRYIKCRPTDLVRELSGTQLFLHNQAIALRAADPRHYSVIEHRVVVPITTLYSSPSIMGVNNLGNAPAYPLITVTVPSTVSQITRLELINATSNTSFDVRAVMTSRSVLIGDMPARITGAPRSVVTVDGQSKYGAWQFPRTAFRLDPGSNNIYVRTEPEGQPVTVELRFRDTWSG